jgi:hypothetical protein
MYRLLHSEIFSYLLCRVRAEDGLHLNYLSEGKRVISLSCLSSAQLPIPRRGASFSFRNWSVIAASSNRVDEAIHAMVRVDSLERKRSRNLAASISARRAFDKVLLFCFVHCITMRAHGWMQDSSVTLLRLMNGIANFSLLIARAARECCCEIKISIWNLTFN